MSDSVTALDGTFLELEEKDESAHMHIGAVMTFAPGARRRPPTLEQLQAQLEERLGALPRYSQRLSEPHTGGLRWPTWEPDPDFDITQHVHQAALPAPGDRAELLRWAGDYWSSRLDRHKPLWDAVLIEGLEGGRWALATKTHHALVDGVGSVDVTHLMLDASPRPRRRPAKGRPDPEVETSEQHGLLRAIPEAILQGVRSGVDVAMHPSKIKEALERSAALAELIVREEVVAAPRTSLNVPIGTRRRFEVVRAELADLKAVKKELGGTVNDVVLAIATGGLRRLLLERGEQPPGRGLRAMVPVNIRDAAEQLGLGNKITSLFVELPVAEPDPLRRYRLTAGNAESLKSGSQGVGGSALLDVTSLAPPILHSVLARSLFASRLFNVTVTNVPGPQQPLYSFGSRLEDVYPVVPLAADHAVGIAAVSYAGRVFFGLHGDERAASDLEVLRDGMEQSLGELFHLAEGSQPRRRRPDRKGAVAATPVIEVAAPLKHVHVSPLRPERLKEVLTPQQSAEFDRTIARGRAALHGRAIWSVNSTMRGGGVAEMLAPLVSYVRGAGIDSRWVVIRGDEGFFRITKRLHNRLHGEPGDGGPLGEEEDRIYRDICDHRARSLGALVQEGDIVLLHDPQTAGMASRLRERGAVVVWRAHIGIDLPNDLARDAWRFLLRYVEPADAYVFSRQAFAWSDLEASKVSIIPPSIDAFSPKNQTMDEVSVAGVLRCGGVEAGPSSDHTTFTRLDGSPARVDSAAEVVAKAFPADAPLLLQVSRWDRLKDHAGVLQAFSEHVAPRTDAHLALVGPDSTAVADDPEAVEVLEEITAARAACPGSVRERIHLISLPMTDIEENGAFVNALQRRATVIAQKSLAEGFGLTVTEAMWKGKPVVASRVGGIRDQIVDGDTGVLVEPDDLKAFGKAVVRLLEKPHEAVAMGMRAREQVRANFLGPRHLGQYVDLFERLLTAAATRDGA